MSQPSDKSNARPGDGIAPSSYRKKPVVIQAIRWSGTNLKEVIDFTGLHPSANKWTWEEYESVVAKDGFKIFTLEGAHMVSVGDYVIRGVKGEFYACKPDIFWMTYERESVVQSSTAPISQQEALDQAHAVGYREGYEKALSATLPTIPCSLCGCDMVIRRADGRNAE